MTTKYAKEAEELLRQLDAQYKDLFVWLAKLYDPNTGGFFYALSSLEEPKRFQADIESTTFVVSMLARCEMLDTMPEPMKRKLIQFLQSRQDPTTGFFFDPHNEMRTIERMRGRSLQFCTVWLERLGAAPLHPLPGAREDNPHLNHLASPDAFRDWLDKRPWHHAWTGVDHLASQVSVLRSLPPKKRDALLDVAFKYLAQKQDKTTGLWGGGEPYVRVSGGFKAAAFYDAFETPIPNPDKIYHSTLECLRAEKAADFCWVRNPMDLIESLKPHRAPIPENERLEIIRISIRNMKTFRKADGGFSRHIDRAAAAPNSVVLGLGKVESDMNATTQSFSIRRVLYDLAGVKMQPVPYSKDFYKLIEPKLEAIK